MTSIFLDRFTIMIRNSHIVLLSKTWFEHWASMPIYFSFRTIRSICLLFKTSGLLQGVPVLMVSWFLCLTILKLHSRETLLCRVYNLVNENMDIQQYNRKRLAIYRGFIKGRAQGKLTSCERDLAINLPSCFDLLF